MRKFNVVVEDTKFELEVEEEKTVPMILTHQDHHVWIETGHQELMVQVR